MAKRSKTYSTEFKLRVVIETIKNELTVNQITSKFGIHANQIYRWKQQAPENIKAGFQSKLTSHSSNEALIDELYKEIGRQKVELEWLKKRVYSNFLFS